MKFAVALFCLLTLPAFAQPAPQPPAYRETPQMLLDQALSCERLAGVKINELVEANKKLMAENEALKPKEDKKP